MKKYTIFFNCLLLLSTSILAATPNGWRNEKPCARSLPPPQPTQISSCLQAYCSPLPMGSRICVCLKSEDTGQATVSIESKNLAKKEWDIELNVAHFGPSGLKLDAGDLDGDGKDEVLLAIMETESQGIGVQRWKVWAIDENNISEPISMEDYGTMGFLTCNTNRREALLLRSQWLEGWEPRRGDGLYMAAQWFELSSGELTPVRDWPGIYRRYLNSLAKVRENNFVQNKSKPVLWYSSPSVRIITGPYPFK